VPSGESALNTWYFHAVFMETNEKRTDHRYMPTFTSFPGWSNQIHTPYVHEAYVVNAQWRVVPGPILFVVAVHIKDCLANLILIIIG
jgi:hypothetical protein